MPRPLLQAGAVPYLLEDGTPRFCLITSMKKGRWQFPKGIIDPGETWVETALKEAEEEAGIRGRIVGKPMGTYRYEKWGLTCEVTMALMEVTDVLDDWEEEPFRKRRFVRAAKARKLIKKPALLTFLETSIQRLDA